jgi:hypothetical protein
MVGKNLAPIIIKRGGTIIVITALEVLAVGGAFFMAGGPKGVRRFVRHLAELKKEFVGLVSE